MAAMGAEVVRFDRPYLAQLGRYAFFQFVLLVAATVALSFLVAAAGAAVLLAAIGLIGWGFANLGGLFDGRSWAFRSEAARVMLAPALPLLGFSGAAAWGVAALLALGVPLYFAWCASGSAVPGAQARGAA